MAALREARDRHQATVAAEGLLGKSTPLVKVNTCKSTPRVKPTHGRGRGVSLYKSIQSLYTVAAEGLRGKSTPLVKSTEAVPLVTLVLGTPDLPHGVGYEVFILSF